jgi:hypothetical protein
VLNNPLAENENSEQKFNSYKANEDFFEENNNNNDIIDYNEEKGKENNFENALLEMIVKLSNKNLLYDLDLSEETTKIIDKFKSD